MTSTTPNFGDVLAVGRALDLRLPDSRTVADAYARARDASEPSLFHHVVRSWLYAAALARARSLAPDAELLAVATLLHDLGLARAFAVQHGMGGRRSEVVWDAIALHTTPSIGRFKGVDVACCQSGIGCDYGGLGYPELSGREQDVILAAYPRLGMKAALTTCLCGIATHHPETTRDNFIAEFGERYVPGYRRPSLVDFLLHAPFAE
ncbi:HD domain-containing protein [Gemmatimonadetes bacterium T265]|nr:HD domain-containing protein [Gemmatimonadetes bacterium T265]